MNQNDRIWAQSVLEKCEQKYLRVAEKHANGIPYTTDAHGNYDNRADSNKNWRADDGLNWWTNGFWGGILWHLYARTQNERMAQLARHSEELLDACFVDFLGLHHDVGFMWLPTAVANYRLTGDMQAKKRALHAAQLLAGRFNLAGGYIRAWNDLPDENTDTRGWAIIDCMLNISLLYWASETTHDPRYRHIAMAHADTVMRTFIRADGSSHHIVEFDPVHGGVVRTHGGQGYADGSAWTRGQAWALYGFVVSYLHTGKGDYLFTAKKVADYFVLHIPQNRLIPIDFDQPNTPALEDCCAAAIAACGLLELAKQCEGAAKEKYEGAALDLLKALDALRCNYDTTCDAIVTHCSGAYHSAGSHHITMSYADYYYIEALTKLCGGNDAFLW